jgi:predicted NAD/FAD-binding protein
MRNEAYAVLCRLFASETGKAKKDSRCLVPLRQSSGILAYSGFPKFAALPAEGMAATVV